MERAFFIYSLTRFSDLPPATDGPRLPAEVAVTRINIGRVVLGGLVAGLVINASEFVLNMFVVADDMNAAIQRLNLPPIGGTAIVGFTVFGFVLGIALTWLYAAIRPRFGPGPRTAVVAGAAVYFFAYLYPSLGMQLIGMFPARLMEISLVWGFVEVLAAAVAGASLYQEPSSPAAARVSRAGL